MSRTYRGKDRKKKGIGRYHRGSRTGQWREEVPPCYRNARRQRCISSNTIKWWFHSKGAALEAAKYNFRNRSERGKTRKFERVYHCRTCDGWHLTTMDWDAWHDRKQEIADINGVELDEDGNFKGYKPITRYPDEI